MGQGNLTWAVGTKVLGGKIGGTISPSDINPDFIKVTQDSSLVVNVSTVSVAKIPHFTMSQPLIDAYVLKPSANYLFDIDSKGRRTVTVKNVNNIQDGIYFLGNYQWDWTWGVPWRNYQDFLCSELNSDNQTCISPSFPWQTKTICEGYSLQSCVSYQSDSKTWRVNGVSLATGVAWFEGDLQLSNGTYFNTFIASGNIATSDGLVVYSPNYAGYQAICGNNPMAYSNWSNNLTIDSDFADIYPSNLCDTSKKKMVSIPLGNVSLVSGGYRGGGFYGGSINLGASNAIYGDVLAGDILGTGGSSTVYGHIIASGQNTSSAGSQTWQGSTTVQIPSNRSGYDPNVIPCMVNCGSGPSSGQAKVIWSRYL